MKITKEELYDLYYLQNNNIEQIVIESVGKSIIPRWWKLRINYMFLVASQN